MVVYTVTRGKSETGCNMTLHVEGRVTSGNWEKLREFCLDALKNSDRLVLDLEKVSECDFSLSIFVCLLKRTVLLLGKSLTVLGNQKEFFCMFEATLGSRAKRCSFSWASSCYLCGDLLSRTSVGELFGSDRWGEHGTLPSDFSGNL